MIQVDTDIVVEVELVTPEIAAFMLKQSEAFYNRALNRGAVAVIAHSIRTGQWKLNAETIKVTSDGRLIDGQHRLHAVIQAAQSVPMAIARNVSEDVFDTIDKGKRRSAADTLHVAGKHDVNNLAACIGVLARYANSMCASHADKMPRKRFDCDSNSKFVSESVGVAIVEYANRNAGISESIRYINSVKTVDGMKPVSFMAAIHYLFGLADAERRDTFFAEVIENTGMIGSGSYAIVQARRSEGTRERMDISKEYKGAVWIKAWNYDHKNWDNQRSAPIKKLVWMDKEKFPPIAGVDMEALEPLRF